MLFTENQSNVNGFLYSAYERHRMAQKNTEVYSEYIENRISGLLNCSIEFF